MRYARSILDLVGNTPLLQLSRVVPSGDGAPLVLAKVESFNPGGSVKDRIGLSMIEAEEEAGRLGEGGTIVEGTSGNTGVGLALVAGARGYRVVFTMPDKMALEKQRLLEAYGAEVVRCPTNVAPDDPRSYYSVARRLAKETENAVYPNQYEHQANPEAHYRTTGPEIWEQTEGRVTHFICGAGTGGTISGTGKYLKEQNPDVHVVGVDPAGSILAHYHETCEIGEAQQYKIEGIGEDLIPGATWFEQIDDFVVVDDDESYDMTLRMAREEGVLCGSSSGAAVAGVAKYLQENELGADDVVVTLLPDTGERYLSKLFNKPWLRANGFLPRAERLDDVALSPAPSVAGDDEARRVLELSTALATPAVLLQGDDHWPTPTAIEVETVRTAALTDAGALDGPAADIVTIELPVLDAATPLGQVAEHLVATPAVAVRGDDDRIHGLATRAAVLSGMGHG